MRIRKIMMVAAGGIGALALGSVAEAQSYGRHGVPPGHLPPPGQCRVWLPDRPPGHQPPPTSCRRAERLADRFGGRVVYGGRDWRDRDVRWEHRRDWRDRDDRWDDRWDDRRRWRGRDDDDDDRRRRRGRDRDDD